MKLLPFKICYFFKLLEEDSTASTEPDLDQRRNDYCQILISHYSPPLYQRRYQSNLIVEMTLFPYRICYFSKFSLENSTACMYTDLNQRPKDYCEILISRYSPPLYQSSYQWNLIVEITLYSYKICYFLKLSLENSTGCTYPDLNQRPKYYSQSLISCYSPPVYELSYQWNVSDSVSSIEMKILPCKMCHFFKIVSRKQYCIH